MAPQQLGAVHAGQIRATGRAENRAENIRWELGSREAPCVRVDGRQHLAECGDRETAKLA